MSSEKQKTILLVEDEVVIAMVEKFTLEKFGYDVITANSGEEAIEIFKKTPSINLILMDIDLGAGIDGSETAAIILHERDLPVVFLSSHMEPEVVEKTEKITSYGYVVKNSSNTVLDASIKMAFKLYAAKTKEQEKESQMEAALEALRESEASYRVLFSGASDGILLADSQTKEFHYANPAMCRMMGYSEEEFLRISMADIHPKESLNQVLAEFAAMVRGEIVSSSDLPCLRKDGTLFYANISHSTMALEGREYHAGFFHDITERKRVSDALRESELRLKAQYQGIPIPTFTWQKQGEDFELIDYNDAAKVITHENVIEYVGRKASDLYANRQDILWDLQQCFVERKVIRRETLSEHFVPGQLMALTIVFIPPDLVMVHMEDITERKREEEELQKLASVVRHSSELINLSTPDGKMIFLNEAGSEVLGISPEEVNQTNIMQVIPAHLKDKVEKEILPALLNAGKWSGDMQYINMKTGQLRDFLSTTFAIKDPNTGKTLYLANVSRDITERKRTESQREAALEAMRNSEEKYRGLTENISLGIYRNTIGPEGKFIEANPAIVGMFGYKSKEEFLAITVSDLYQNPEDRNKFNDKMLKEGFVRGEELWLKKKDGSFFVGFVSAVAVKDEQGHVKYYDGIIDDFTERKQVESQRESALEALRESEKKYRTLVEKANEAILIVQDSVFVFTNRRMSDLLGVPARDLEGKSFIDFVWPEDRELVIANYSKRIAGETVRDTYDFRIIGAGGRLTWISLSAAVIQWKGKNATLNLLTDITERKHAEKLAETLYKISQAVYSTDNLNELFEQVHRALSSIIPTDNLFIALISDDGKELTFPYNIDEKDAGIAPVIAADNTQSLTVEVLKSKRPLLLDETELLDRYATGRNKVWGTAPKCWLGVPLLIRETVIGVMAVQDYHKSGAYSRKDVTLLESAASQIAIAIERKQAEKALREGEEWNKVILHTVLAGVIVIEVATRKILEVNDTALKLIGLPKEQVIGSVCHQFICPAEEKNCPILDLGKEVDFSEKTLLTANGKRKNIIKTVVPVQLHGRSYLIESFVDITERKQVESQRESSLEALRESEFKFRAIIDLTHDWEYWQGQDGKIIYMSPSCERMTGYSPNDFISNPELLARIIHKDDASRMRQHFEKVHAIENIQLIEELVFRIIKKDGSVVYIEHICKPIFDEKNQYLGRRVSNRDTSERKRAEDALRESETRFDQLAEQSRAIAWEVDSQGLYTYISRVCEAVLAYRQDELIGRMHFYDLHPEEGRAAFKKDAFAVFERKAPFKNLINPMQAKDGRVVWVSTNGIPQLNADGTLRCYRGSDTDITERERAEEEIKRQLAEKEILLKEVHHRIKNSIASIGGLISLRLQSISNSEAIAVLQEALGRVNSMRILYDKLLLTESYKDISVKNYVESLSDSVVALFPDNAKVTLDKQIADFHLDAKRLFPLGIIINELITNIMKYAFINRDTGLIKIALTNVDNHVMLVIQDNGNGLPEGFDINESKGFGLMLVKMLSQQLGGSFSIENQAVGTRCAVEFTI